MSSIGFEGDSNSTACAGVDSRRSAKPHKTAHEGVLSRCLGVKYSVVVVPLRLRSLKHMCRADRRPGVALKLRVRNLRSRHQRSHLIQRQVVIVQGLLVSLLLRRVAELGFRLVLLELLGGG